jgi:hypothetical protein
MASGARTLATKAIAVVIIVALLDAVGVPPVIMMMVTGAVLVVWLFARHTQSREVEKLFDFYVAADAILREEERRWYAFEISEVISEGERSLEAIADPPPLHLFVLASLHYRLGEHKAAVEYLSRVVEDERYDELHRAVPSPQLRRYVSMLRRIEDEPSIAPQALAAVRNLERARKKHARELLLESRERLEGDQQLEQMAAAIIEAKTSEAAKEQQSGLQPLSAPPPISEVLHNVYDEQSPSN